MNTAFDVELTDTLRDLAEEVGPGPADLASVALNRGRQFRRRRTALLATAVVVALAAAATPLVMATHHSRTNTAASSSHLNTTSFKVFTSNGTPQQESTDLRKRLIDAGFTVLRSSLHSDYVQFAIQSTLPVQQMQNKAVQLTGPGIMEFRSVLATAASPKLTSDLVESAMGTSSKPQTLASVKAKLGKAYTAAERLTGPAELNASNRAKFSAFTTLTYYQVHALPIQMQFDVPTINCAQIVDPEPIEPSAPPAADQIVTCDQGNGPRTKYLLSAAQLTNADIAAAKPVHDPTLGWQMDLTFTPAGQQRWADLGNQEHSGSRVAAIMDGVLLATPAIPSPTSPSATLSAANPRFTKESAALLAIVLNDGPLPTRKTWTVFEIAPPHCCS